LPRGLYNALERELGRSRGNGSKTGGDGQWTHAVSSSAENDEHGLCSSNDCPETTTIAGCNTSKVANISASAASNAGYSRNSSEVFRKKTSAVIQACAEEALIYVKR
jgi:hypothetical protein